MTAVRELRLQARSSLAGADVPSPQVDADLLLAHVLKVTPSMLPLVRDVSAQDVQAFAALVRRRVTREPLQHLTGRAPFRTLELEVGPGVFVPRPETELLAGWVIEALRSGQAAPPDRRARVVDIGTGSGAVALAVAVEVPTTAVVAVEADPDALVWARRNIDRVSEEVRVRVELVAASASELGPTAAHTRTVGAAGTVDVVVSNPPYVPPESVVAPEVRWDPAQAVFAESGGCAVIADVVAAALRLLRPGGWLALEHDETTAADVAALLPSAQWTAVATHPDLTGRPRFTVARRRGPSAAAGSWS